MNDNIFVVGTKVVTTKEIISGNGILYPVGSKGSIIYMDTNVVMVSFSNPISYYRKTMFAISEFIQHFKVYEERKWTGWKKYDEVLGWQNKHFNVYYRHNGKRIQAKIYCGDKILHATTTCCEGDKFDLEFGMELAIMRLASKLMQYEAKSLIAQKYPL